MVNKDKSLYDHLYLNIALVLSIQIAVLKYATSQKKPGAVCYMMNLDSRIK